MNRKNKSISRRDFMRKSIAGVLMASTSGVRFSFGRAEVAPLRLGGPVKAEDPENWVNNPISPNDEVRRKALARCRAHLALADRIGAKCCVNVSGSRGEQWAGPDPNNLTEETFDLIVESTRKIIDDVKPKRTYFTLETMPWAFPDSADSYLRLIKAIDRRRFAVHLDPVNLINSPRRYFDNAGVIGECFRKLGPFIKSCHAKDIILEKRFTTHLNEVRPGLGGLDYATFLRVLSKLPDTPLMLEHLETQEEYRLAADHIRSVAKKIGLSC